MNDIINTTSDIRYIKELVVIFNISHENDIYIEDSSDDEFEEYELYIRDDAVFLNHECESRKLFDFNNHGRLLIHDCYDDQHINSCCPIYMIEFKEGDEVVVLPCGHSFIPDAIYQWLDKQSNTCPFCRYELPFIIKKIEINRHF